MKRLVLAFAVVVAGCQPQARSVSFFEAHPGEIASAVAECVRGTRRGEECENARAADGALKAKQRQELFRRSFK